MSYWLTTSKTFKEQSEKHGNAKSASAFTRCGLRQEADCFVYPALQVGRVGWISTLRAMKVKPPARVLWLAVLLPSAAHASSFALVLFPSGVVTAMLIASTLLARGRRWPIRVASAIAALVTAVGIFLLPIEFYDSKVFQFLESWLGEWAFFILALVPTLVMAFLVLRLGACSPDRPDAR